MADANSGGYAVKGAQGIFKLVASFAPVPGLIPAADLLFAVLIVLDNVKTNQEENKRLGQHCYELTLAVYNSCSPRKNDTSYVKQLVDGLIQVLDRIMERASRWHQAPYWQLVAKFWLWKGEIAKAHQEIDDALKEFHVKAILTVLERQASYEEARQKDHASFVNLIMEYPKRIPEITPDEAPEAAESIQRAISTPGVKTEQRIRLEQSISLVLESTGQVAPPMPLTESIIELVGDNAQWSGNNFTLWKGLFRNKFVSVRRMDHSNATPEKIIERFNREVGVWRKIWNADKGKYTLLIMGFSSVSFGPGQAQPVIICPWSDNGNSFDYVRKNRQLSVSSLIMGIARGIRVLHDLSLIHGDVRAENVEIDKDGKPLLTGFGWTKMSDEFGRAPVTSSQRLADQPRFRAPENQADVLTFQSLKGDIFSFAMTMLQLFTRSEPFPEIIMPPVAGSSISEGKRPGRPLNNLEVNDKIWELMNRCWDHDPNKRPDIRTVLKELKRAWPQYRT